MAIISISRPYCSRGRQIAEKVAERLGYDCISREVLIEASGQFNIPEVQLAKAISEGPSFFERLTHGREKYIACVKAALLNHVKKNNVVYHGLAGHFFLQGISHALKVRTIADFESRVKEEMVRENVTENVAMKLLQADDESCRKWALHIYGIDQNDPDLYDMILNLRQISIDDCVDIIQRAAMSESFATTDESKKRLYNMALAANIKAVISEKYADAIVSADEGRVDVLIPKTVSNKNLVISEISSRLVEIEEVKEINVMVNEEITARSLMYMSR